MMVDMDKMWLRVLGPGGKRHDHDHVYSIVLLKRVRSRAVWFCSPCPSFTFLGALDPLCVNTHTLTCEVAMALR